MTPEQVSKELRKVATNHKGLPVNTFEIRVSDMAEAAANAIDELLLFTTRISELSSCKSCGNRSCGVYPGWDEEVRYNCHLYRKDEGQWVLIR